MAKGKNRKLTMSHTTFIPLAKKLWLWGEKQETVEKIVAGLIQHAKTSINALKIKHETGCILIISKDNKSIQEVRFYVSDSSKFILNLMEYAEENNIKVSI